MQLVIDTSNTNITVKSKRFLIFNEEQKRLISPHKISSIAIKKSTCELSASVVLLAIEHQIPILFFNRSGRLKGRLWSPYFGSISTLRRHQIHFANTTQATNWIIESFQIKTAGQIQILNKLANEKSYAKKLINENIAKMKKQLAKFNLYSDKSLTSSKQEVMGIEGYIAKCYWGILSELLQNVCPFEKRSRRPAKDIFNATINYLYGMLYARVEGALIAHGLDPQAGFLHADEYNKPTLAFDSIEVFRPMTDQLVVDLAMQKKLLNSYYEKKDNGVWLNSKGKAFLIPTYKRWMKEKVKWQNKKLNRFQHIHQYTFELARKVEEWGNNNEKTK